MVPLPPAYERLTANETVLRDYGWSDKDYAEGLSRK